MGTQDVCVRVCENVGTQDVCVCMAAHMQNLEDNLKEFVISFHDMCFRD